MTVLLRPRWIAGHLLAIVGVVVFVVLGLWQVRRHAEKVDLRDVVAAAVRQPAIDIADAPDGEFLRVAVAGRYDSEYEQRVPRSRDGVSGYDVVVPLVVAEGEAVLVNRGWIGIDEALPVAPGEMTGQGMLWPPETGPAPNEFLPFARRIDPAATSTFTPYRIRGEYLILTEQSPPFDIDAPEVDEIGLGPHLGYAGQWFLFAAVVAVGYPILLRKRSGLASTRE